MSDIKRRRLVTLGFTLSMPNVGSWNGRWTGEKNIYFKSTKVYSDKAELVLQGKESCNFYYDFKDGWGANINVKIYDPKEAKQLLKRSRGFYGYDWMIKSILDKQIIEP